MRFSYILLAAMGLTAAVCTTGCLHTSAAVHDAAFSNQRLEAAIDSPVTPTASATRQALVQMTFVVTSYQVADTRAQVIARTMDDQKIEIEIQRQQAKSCRLFILVGAAGDEEQSRQILEQIRKKLH